MTDLVLVSVLAVMAALLGAASLGIILLYRGWKANRIKIQHLQAQIAAQQIAAITGAAVTAVSAAADAEDELPPEPVRRRRHLALYSGDGLAATYSTCLDSVRQLARTRPVITTAAVATAATVGTAAALVLVTSGDSGGAENPHGSPTVATDQQKPGSNATPAPGASEREEPPGVGSGTGGLWADGPLSGGAPVPADTSPPAAAFSAAGEEGSTARRRASGPTAVPDAPTFTRAPDAGPTTSRPRPSTPPPEVEAPEPTEALETADEGLCVKAPPLLDLCLLTGT